MREYQPVLDPAELRSAAEALMRGGVLVAAQREAVGEARRELVAAGFEGHAPRAALARFQGFWAQLQHTQSVLAQAAQVLFHFAGLQERLDVFFANEASERAVLALQALSEALDRRCAASLRALRQLDERCVATEQSAERKRGHEPLAYYLDIPFAQLHTRYLGQLDSQAQRAVLLADATILEAGPHSATVAVGDVVDPARVITLVAGATTGQPDQLAGELLKARHLHERIGATVVVWQGYDPPATIPHALHRARARQGADNLSEFQAALEHRFPGAQKTVVAHSYGTRVATEAATVHGLIADDLWLLGSAGVAGDSIADFALASDDAAVYTVDASDDPILHTRAGSKAVLGASPSTTEYGATLVEGVNGGHSDYFTDPSFLSALAQSGIGTGGRRKE